ncbi:MAG: bifunctional 2-polyprenyl-6-hydroxyphenol methylase/3-demethylubiquinol 3-O-methyltransferase UbiG [Pseudomonadales bacterium]|jgi:2-polyprenyl-6-hydroxyphenyl methylase/3-demethylubiquinone-9 3-methyltransferase|nr:bifunctional 2-polyprenyl-6-hydroxyphenol methylase/3-demethylubiquinol 3-O-methyltransferase UbiG [Pseudomonadales bacterium]
MNDAVRENVDPAEVAKFEAMAHRWWDPEGDFRPLHDINPVRLDWIAGRRALAGARVVDVGCGGGLLSEGMAQAGADVVGIDAGKGPLTVARLHALEAGVEVDYRLQPAESLAAEQAGTFDAVTCLEMLEHVPDPGSVVKACAALAKPGGDLFFATLNRNPKSWALAVVGAEYLLGLLPKGTHDYARFMRPSELARLMREAGLKVEEIVGLTYNPLSRQCRISKDVDVNYLLHARKPA